MILALLVLLPSQRPDRYWLSAMALLSILLAETALSLRELRQRARERDQQLSTLSAISQAMQNATQLDEILVMIQQRVRQHLGVDNFYVALYDEPNNRIWYPMAVKGGQIVYWAVRPLTNRLTDRVILERRPLLLSGQAHRELERIGLPLGEEPLSAWMGVPLLMNDRAIGCLAVFSYSPLTSFSYEDLGFLQTLAGQVAVVAQNRLLSEQIQQSEQRLQKMSLQSRQRELLTETLVHDLRSPIGTVLNALEVIATTVEDEEVPPKETLLRAVEIARQGATRLLKLTDRVLEIARMEEGDVELHRQPISVSEWLFAIYQEYQPRCAKERLAFRLHLGADLPVLDGDEEKLSRVLRNLLDNAINFTPHGGEIRLSAFVPQRGQLRLQVEDTGPGIPPADREKVFERFYQVSGQPAKQRGTGLGLTFCKLVVEAHGGEIWVESSPEGGCRMVIQFPTQPLEAA
ncbi:MAG: ATP-binding protein [Anaerolineales bacterium]|nr:ATP-binding protein [Anaerolineales bacterium]MDW8161366.1 ATP-binding protein [Anaerolineales bacterium]